MDNVICFYREPFFTYKGFAVIGVLACLLCGTLLCLRFRFGRRELPRMLGIVLLGFGGAIVMMKALSVGAKAIYQSSIGEPRGLVWLIEHAGAVFYGCVLGFFGVLALLLPRLVPQRRRLGLDIWATAFALGHGFLRMGCYCSTKVEDGWLVWHPCCGGIQMDNAFCAHFYDSRLPTQLMESAAAFLLFAVMLTLLLRGKCRGKLPALYLGVYAVFRYLIEFVREGVMDVAIGPFSYAQFFSLLILLGILLVATLRQKGVLRAPPEDAPKDAPKDAPEGTPEDVPETKDAKDASR